MKNLQKGFIVPLLLAIVAFLLVGEGVYVHTQKKVTNVPMAGSSSTQETSTTEITAPQTVAPVLETPGIVSIAPSFGPVGTVAVLSGYFPSGASISFDGQVIDQVRADMHSYSFVVPNTIKAQGFGAPPTVSVYPGRHSISLSTGGPSAGNSVKFMVTLTTPTQPPTGAPTVTSVSPSEITVGVTKEVTIHGSNFSSKSMIAVVGAGVVTSIGPTRISPDGTSMIFSFPEALTMPALYSVDVYAIGDVPDYTHGGPRIYNSTAVVTLVNPYTPAITSISPTSGAVGSIVTIRGSNFYGDSRVSVGTWLPSVATDFGPITISSYTNTSLSFIVPSSMSPGKYVISVAGSAGHRSDELTFTVVAQ